MKERSITELEAETVLRRLIKSYVAESVRVCEDTQRNHELSSDLRTYVEAAQYSVSGNLVWSLSCPRYHPEVSFNDTQLSMMKERHLL